MLAQATARVLARAGVHYAWAIVAIVFLVSLTTAGVMGIPGALIVPLGREFGWTTEQISSALALRILLYGLIAPFTAALIDRYGLTRVVVFALALIVSGLVLTLPMSKVWHLVALWGVVVGLGTGFTANVMGAVVATRWFAARRGLVVGVLTAASATGQLVFLPLAAWLAEHYGWRAALLPPIGALVVVGVVVVLFIADRPEAIGLRAYGEAPGAAPQIAPKAAFSRAFRVLGEVSGSGVFWILAATFFVCGLSTNGLVQTHFIALCQDFDVPPVSAASTLAAMGAFDFVGTILSGWLADRYDNRALLFVYYGLRGLSLLYLPSSSFSVYGLSLFAVFYGLDWVATVPPTVRLAAVNFGRDRAGVAYGWIFTAHMLGAALAAYGAGYSRATLQTYLPAFYAAGAACLVAAAIIWLIARPPPAAAPNAVAPG